MNHEYWENLLVDYEDGVLDPQTAALVENHLKDCEECQSLLPFSVERDALQRWFESAPSFSVEEALAARIARQRERSLPRSIRQLLSRTRPIPRVVRKPIAIVPIAVSVAVAILLLVVFWDTGGLSPNVAVVQAYENLLSLKTLRYTTVEEQLECIIGGDQLLQSTTIEDQCFTTGFEAGGEIVFPNSWHETHVPGSGVPRGPFYSEILVVNGESYVKSDAGWVKWEDPYRQFLLSKLFPVESLDLIVRDDISFEELPEEPIDGSATDHYRAQWQQDGTSFLMEVWVGKDNHLLRKVYQRAEATDEILPQDEPPARDIDGVPVVRMGVRRISQTYVFSDFNALIVLEAPDLGHR